MRKLEGVGSFWKKRGDKRCGSGDKGETSLTRVLETRSYRVLFRGLMASKLSFSYLEWRPEGADPAVNGHLQRRWERLRREKTERGERKPQGGGKGLSGKLNEDFGEGGNVTTTVSGGRAFRMIG